MVCNENETGKGKGKGKGGKGKADTYTYTRCWSEQVKMWGWGVFFGFFLAAVALGPWLSDGLAFLSELRFFFFLFSGSFFKVLSTLVYFFPFQVCVCVLRGAWCGGGV